MLWLVSVHADKLSISMQSPWWWEKRGNNGGGGRREGKNGGVLSSSAVMEMKATF